MRFELLGEMEVSGEKWYQFIWEFKGKITDIIGNKIMSGLC